MNTPYDEDYYLRGQETGKSNYSDYRWLPDLTLPMADHAKWLLHLKDTDRVLDFGCSRGYFVKALRMRGVDAHGFDISQWAIDNCDPAVADYVSTSTPFGEKNWDIIWAKDVLEHIEAADLEQIVPQMLAATRRMVFVIVPLALQTGGGYGCHIDEMDQTHVIRWPLQVWLEFLQKFDKSFVVSGSFEMPVLKPNAYHYPRSYGFITMRRVAS